MLRLTPARRLTAALSITETVSYGVLYYAFAVFLVPMQRDTGFSAAELTGAFSLALLVSGAAGLAAGRYLDRHAPRTLMTAGSAAGALLVLAWSRVESVAALYAVWAGIGLVMAAVLYETAFTVLAKHVDDPGERRRAMTVMTLVAALASFVFVPLSQALVDAHGWRDALVVLAAALAAITVPLHAWAVPSSRPVPSAAGRGRFAGEVLRSRRFWMLSGAFFLASLAAVAVLVHAVPALLARGYDATFAAFVVGLAGLAQIPGRLLFVPLAERLSPAAALALVVGLVGAGIAVVAGAPGTGTVVVGMVLVGMGNGMTTLARATVISDRYGVDAYGTISSFAGAASTLARAAGPVAAALYAAAAGYDALLWTLAAVAALGAIAGYRAEAAPSPRPRASAIASSAGM